MAAKESGNRDEFPLRVRHVIAQRAAYHCSNPDCRRLTVRPHSDPEKALTSGVAAHVRAASRGGPRYDSTQTESERTSATNGIWLCHTCSDLVDKDEVAYPASLLEAWRTVHEKWVANTLPSSSESEKEDRAVRARADEMLDLARERALTVETLTATVEISFELEDDVDLQAAALLERERRGAFQGSRTFVFKLPARGVMPEIEVEENPAFRSLRPGRTWRR